MLLLAPSAAAQQVPAEYLRVGDRLRVQHVDAQPDVEGRLLLLAHDTLWLRCPYYRDTLRYLSPMIRQLHVASGMSPSDGAVRGAAIGFVGLLTLAFMHPRDYRDPCAGQFTLDCRQPKSQLWLIPASVLTGAVVGAAVARERWTPVRWPPSGEWEPESPERSLVHGRRVRVDTGAGTFSARVDQRLPDTLVLIARGAHGRSLHLPNSSVRRIAVATGPSRPRRRLMGAAVGAGIGVAAAYYLASVDECRGCESVAREWELRLIPPSAVLGALINGRRGEQWTSLRWPP